MMIALAALALALADPSAARSAPAAAAAPAEDAPPSLADLQQVYDESCAAREFGAYDDVCDQLRKQIRQAQADQARAARAKAAPTARAPQPR